MHVFQYIAGKHKAPVGGGGLMSMLRMAVCPVWLAQSLCHCVTKERTENLVNYTVSNVIFTELYV